MADPATIAGVIGLVGAIGQTGAGIASSLSQEKAAKAEAESIETATRSQERKQRRANEKILAKNRALAAASGVDPGSGSSLTLLLEDAKEARLEELTIRQRGLQSAENKRAEGRAARGQIGGQIFQGLFQSASVLGGFVNKRRKAPRPPRAASNLSVRRGP